MAEREVEIARCPSREPYEGRLRCELPIHGDNKHQYQGIAWTARASVDTRPPPEPVPVRATPRSPFLDGLRRHLTRKKATMPEHALTKDCACNPEVETVRPVTNVGHIGGILTAIAALTEYGEEPYEDEVNEDRAAYFRDAVMHLNALLDQMTGGANVEADRWDEGWNAAVVALCPFPFPVPAHPIATARTANQRIGWAIDHKPEGNPYRQEGRRG